MLKQTNALPVSLCSRCHAKSMTEKRVRPRQYGWKMVQIRY
ncbi:MAG: hypothetical protein WCZ87_08090 [Thiohalobacteraceae bacterium]